LKVRPGTATEFEAAFRSAQRIIASTPGPHEQHVVVGALVLRQLLPEARGEALTCVEITTGATNAASRRVIQTNGGDLVETFVKPAQYGGGQALRYRIQVWQAPSLGKA
jgi:hypothetical protein